MSDKVSIVIPAYNAEPFIQRTIESVQKQTYQNIEVVVVDDKSTDRTVEICRKIAEAYTNVKLLERAENGGQMSARNDGIVASSGDWILFLDSDDVLAKTVIEKLVDKAMQYDPDVIFGGYETINSIGKRTEFRADIADGVYTAQDFGSFLFDKMPINVLTCVGAKLYKTEFIKKRKDFTGSDVETNADMAFVIDSLLSCRSVYYFDEICYTYLLRDGSITYSYRERMYPRVCYARRRIREYLKMCNCYEEKKLRVELLQYTLIRKSLIQEVKFKKGYKRFKAVLKEIAEEERTAETALIIEKEDPNIIHRVYLFLVMHELALPLYVLSLWP